MKEIPFDNCKIEVKYSGNKYIVDIYLRYSKKNDRGVAFKSSTIHKEYSRLGNALNGLALLIDRIPISVGSRKEIVGLRRPRNV